MTDETKRSSSGRKTGLIIIAIVVAFVALAAWILSTGSTYKAGYKGVADPSYVKGVVIKNVPSTDDVLGGDSYLELLGDDNSIYTIYYRRGANQCSAQSAGAAGDAAVVGERVTVYGVVTGEKEMTVCSSDYFYIQPIGTTGPYASWLTYSDPAAGFELKYPQNWQISTSSQSEGSVADFAPQGDSSPMVKITVIGGGSDFALGEWIRSFYGISADDEADATLGGAAAIVFPISNGPSSHNVLVTKEGDNIIQFEFPDPTVATDKDSVALPALILKSVVFTRPDATSTASEALDSGISGKVFLGPTCPVETNPPSPNCADKPYKASLRIIDSGGLLAARVSTAADGTWERKLPPGIYTIENDANSIMPSLGPKQVVVPPHTIVFVPLTFDSGIR